MDGYLKIKTKLDNSGIDKDAEQLENKIKKLQEDNSNASTEQNLLQKEIDGYEQLVQKADEYKNRINELIKSKQELYVSNGFTNALPNSKLPEFGEISAELTNVQGKYANINNEISKQSPKIDRIYNKLTKVKAKQSENNVKILEYKRRIDSIKLNKVQSGLDTVGKKIQSSISKLGRMGMAVFGIRTAFSAVRQAINAVSQYNPKIAADFEYMRYCIASLLTPAIQGLVKLLYTVLSYINAIASAWFGINLFGNASVKNFQKMQKSAGGTAKSAKEIKKSLQGFDEMNVLQDNNNSGDGVVSPSMDLSGIQGNVPQWLKWIMDNKDLMLQLIAGVVAGIIALKIGLTSIQALGIGIAVAGIVSLIQNIITFIQDPSWENFSNILLSISIVLAGIALTLGGTLGTAIASVAALIAGIALIIQGVVAYLNDPTWENFMTILGGIILVVGAVLLLIGGIPALITGIILLVAAIGLAIYKHWDEICQVLGQVGQWIYDNIIKPVGDFFASLWNGICQIFSNVGTWFSNTFNGAKTGVLNAFSSVGQFFQNVWQSICNAFSSVGQFFTSIFKNAYESIKRVFSSIGSFFSGIWSSIVGIFRNIGQRIGEAVSGAFRSAVNAVLSTIERILNTPIRAVNSLIGVINMVPGINLGRLNTFNLPRLAKGGVISQPTQAIIGEAGREAVVPLENNMEWLDILATKLANKIGSGDVPFVINMDGRTVQRGIARRERELAFARNGR